MTDFQNENEMKIEGFARCAEAVVGMIGLAEAIDHARKMSADTHDTKLFQERN